MRQFVDKCFIISEIGESGSIARERADKFKRIIDAALARLVEKGGPKLEPERLDQDRAVDNFFGHVLERVISYRLVVAVLSNRNPNAHLELGLALAAGRPLSLLVAQEADVPSDLRGYNRVLCSLPYSKDGPLDKRAIEALADIMLDQTRKPEPAVAFGRMQPFGKRGAVAYLNRGHEVSFAQWSSMLWDASDRIDIAVTSFKWLVEQYVFFSRQALRRHDADNRTTPDSMFLDILIQKAAFEGARVRLFVIDPGNPFLEHLIHARIPGQRQTKLKAVKEEIERNMNTIREYLKPTANDLSAKGQSFLDKEYPEIRFATREGGSFELVPVRYGSLFSRITLTDKIAFVTPYQLIEPVNTGPGFLLENTTLLNTRGDTVANGLYEKTIENLDELYAMNANWAEPMPWDQLRARFSA